MGDIANKFMEKFDEAADLIGPGVKVPEGSYARDTLLATALAIEAIIDSRPTVTNATHTHLHIPDGYVLDKAADVLQIVPYFKPDSPIPFAELAAERDRYKIALNQIAQWHYDGNYAGMDEPSSTQIAREALGGKSDV